MEKSQEIKCYTDDINLHLLSVEDTHTTSNSTKFNEQQGIKFHVVGLEDPVIEIKGNGDCYIKGKFVRNDDKILDGFHEFFGLVKRARMLENLKDG